MPALSFHRVVKDYGEVSALAGLDLQVFPGRLVCLAGANGAGKTTALDILMGLRHPTAGEARIQGVETLSPRIHEVRRKVGYMPEDPVLYDTLSPLEYLDFVAELYQVGPPARDRAAHLLDELGLAPFSNRRIGHLSMGNRRKVAFAAALLPDPEILILDEPTNGMDVAAARAAKDHLRQHRDRGKTVLFTTHVIELAEALADEVAILHEGKLAAYGAPDELASLGQKEGEATLEDVLLRIPTLASPVPPDVPQDEPASQPSHREGEVLSPEGPPSPPGPP